MSDITRAGADQAYRPVPDVFFDFSSVVVVGASDNPTRIGGLPFKIFEKYGFEGKVYGLNPKYTSVQGYPCFPTADDVPMGTEVALFCLGADLLPAMLPKLAARGVRGVVLFSAGFAEAGEAGIELQQWLSTYCRETGMAAIGPNCVGQVSIARKRPLSFATYFVNMPEVKVGNVALVFQSGGIAGNVWTDAALHGASFSHIITTGNEANLRFSDYLEWLADDPDTTGVVGYIEALGDGPAFCAAAKRMQEKNKPVVVLKVGRSAAGREAAASHTGQMSGDDSGYEAAFRRYGVIRASTLQELNSYARVLSLKNLGRKVTVVSNSGGAGVYCADLCDELGLEMSKLSADTVRKLADVIPSFGRRENPVDLTAQVVNEPAILESTLRILLSDEDCGVLLFVLVGKAAPAQQVEITEMIQKVQEDTQRSIVLPWLGVPEEVRNRAGANGLFVYSDPVHFLAPFASCMGSQADADDADDGDVSSGGDKPVLPTALDLSAGFLQSTSGRRMLTEAAGKQLLSQFEIDVPRMALVRSEADLRPVQDTVTFPCVMKISQPFYAHKSDVGGVVVGITSPAQLHSEWQSMVKRLNATEILVEEQAPEGVEVLVGIQRDPTFGARLTLAAGGIWANFRNDSRTLIPPFSEQYVRQNLARLGIWPQLSGARGRPVLAIDELVRCILKLAHLADSLPSSVSEIEVNPVIVTRDRAVVVDFAGFE